MTGLLELTSDILSHAIPVHVKNGHTLAISIESDTTPLHFNCAAPCFSFQRLQFFQHPFASQKQLLFLPIPLDSDDAIVNGTITNSGKITKKLQLSIETIEYPQEELSVEPSMATPPDDVLARINNEQTEIQAALTQRPDNIRLSEQVSNPLKKLTVTGPYGCRRIFNKVVKSRHMGLDFRAKQGTNIHSCLSGKVVLSQNNWFAGGHIIISHGNGLCSSYCHLSQRRKSVGTTVKSGEVIGLSGMTGRVTGPHLHWGMHIHGVSVDPLQLRQLINQLADNQQTTSQNK